MNRIQRIVEIELTKEECQILYAAEKLLEEMEEAISNISTPSHPGDLNQIKNCLNYFNRVTSRYNVHITLGVE